MTKLTLIDDKNGSTKLRLDANTGYLVLAKESDDSPCCCKKGCVRFAWANRAPACPDGRPVTNMPIGTIQVIPPYEILSQSMPVVSLGGGGADDRAEISVSGNMSTIPMPQYGSWISLDAANLLIFVYDTVGGNVGIDFCICVEGYEVNDFGVLPLTRTEEQSLEAKGWISTDSSDGSPFLQQPGDYPKGWVFTYSTNLQAFWCEKDQGADVQAFSNNITFNSNQNSVRICQPPA